MIRTLLRRRSAGRLAPVTLALAMVGAALWGSSCSFDPVPQEALDNLPSEDEAGPSELHRPGQPCVLCHSDYEGADPPLAVGGTVYREDLEQFLIAPVEGVFVTIYDSAGASQKACTNAAGNFFVRLDDWPDAQFPLTVQVGNRFMRSLVGRDRSCAKCHQLATRTRIENDPTVDNLTGAGRDSAGAILVDPTTVPPEQQCGPNPASSSSSASSGGGGMSGSGGSDGSGGMNGSGGSGASGGSMGSGGAGASGGSMGAGGGGGS